MKQYKRPRPLAIEPDEVYRLGLRLERQDYRAFYYILALTGQRVSEALALTGEDITYKSKFYDDVLEIERPHLQVRSITLKNPLEDIRVLDIFDLVEYDKKEKKMYTTPMMDMWNECRGYVRAIKEMDEKAPLFGNVTRNAIRRYFSYNIDFEVKARIPAETGKEYATIVKGMHPHYLRHCRATWLGRKMNNPQKFCKFFGWADMAQAMRYFNPPEIHI